MEFEGTKGGARHEGQSGLIGYCKVARVIKDRKNGIAIAMMTPTKNPEEATANAELFADALNVMTNTCMSPSQLLAEVQRMKNVLSDAIMEISKAL